MELSVACVLRSGGAYRPEHVAGLARQVAHYLPAARFVCLSDVPVPCERVPLQSDWPGWWAKLELFRHFKGRTLYLDLDTVIVDDPQPAPELRGRFLMVRNWVLPHLFTSAVMEWDGDYSHITRAFEPVAERVMREYVTCERWGDQAFIAEHAGRVDAFPPRFIASYRYGMRQGRRPVPEGTRIVAFNGTHLPWQQGPAWARRWWEPAPAVSAA